MKSGFEDHETSWLYAFLPNESDGTKFGQCFFIGLGLRESFARNLLGENGYFIGFWHFRPNFKLLWHASKWTLCLQKCWILLIYYVVRLQYNFHAHGKSQKQIWLISLWEKWMSSLTLSDSGNFARKHLFQKQAIKPLIITKIKKIRALLLYQLSKLLE